uniref:Uncharacterized protein n=1 Tax=Meloidogyne enterolobii TaxID=390850 RepID=A0A6V7YDG7_MELEN|nr:unnamed protein product [Meloidogyne enterolobii]
MVLYCLDLFYKTLLYPTYPSLTQTNSPIRPGQNITPQLVPQTKYHSPIRSGFHTSELYQKARVVIQ